MPERKYLVHKVRQRDGESAQEFLVFQANVRDIKDWVTVKRSGEVEKGVQRIVKKTRIRSIKRFFEADSRNSIPSGIIVAFPPGSVNYTSISSDAIDCLNLQATDNAFGDKLDLGVLEFSFDDENKPALIVDGQHRFYGMIEVQEEIPTTIFALLDASPTEQAFQFVVINSKAAKVPTDNVKGIIADFSDEKGLQERLGAAGIDYKNYPASIYRMDTDTESPFYGLVDWQLNQGDARTVKVNTLQTCLQTVENTIAGVQEEGDMWTATDILIAIWRAVKETYPDLWLSNNKFMSKVSMVALNAYLTERLSSASLESNVDIYDPEAIQNYVQDRILVHLPALYWSSEWKRALQDNTSMRRTISKDIKMLARNSVTSREWDHKVELVGEPDFDTDEDDDA